MTSDFQTDGAMLRWQTVDGAIHIDSRWQLDADTGVWSRSDTLENVGQEMVILNRCLARFVFAPDHYEVYNQGSRWCNENQGRWQRLSHGTLVLRSEGGRTTQGGTPYVALRPVGASRGVAFHVLPRGNWTIRVRTRTASGGEALPFTVVELGLADESLRLEIPPGGTLSLPEILIQGLPEGQVHLAAPRLHEYVVAHKLGSAKKTTPLVYNTWFDTFEELDVQRLSRQLQAARELGCEVFTIDAGWYGAGSGNWSAQTGDWREKRGAAFRGRMAEFAEQVRTAGLGFGLWMEPERIGPAAPILGEHPEWFIPATGASHRPDLENAAAYDYLLGEMSRLVETYDLAWMKVDYNLDFGHDASGAEFANYYAAWYRLLGELRERYPKTFFEGCAGGGMRLDLNTLSHFDGHFLSDTVNPVDALRIYQGALLRLPPGRLGKWVVLRGIGRTIPDYGVPLAATPPKVATPMGATWERSITTNIDFATRVCLPGMLSLSGDIASLPERDLRRLRSHLDWYKRWRAFIVDSVAHLLTPPRPKDDRRGWAAIQLQNQSREKSLLFVYRLDDARDRLSVYPKKLGEQTYLVRDVDRPEEEPLRRTGGELTGEGLTIELPARHSAAILTLERE